MTGGAGAIKAPGAGLPGAHGAWQTVRDDERGLYEVQFRVSGDGTLQLLRKYADKATGRRYGDSLTWPKPPGAEPENLARPGCEYGHWKYLGVAASREHPLGEPAS